MCVRVCVRKSVCERDRERADVLADGRERECVCVRESVCERETVSRRVSSLMAASLCESERQRESV